MAQCLRVNYIISKKFQEYKKQNLSFHRTGKNRTRRRYISNLTSTVKGVFGLTSNNSIVIYLYIKPL